MSDPNEVLLELWRIFSQPSSLQDVKDGYLRIGAIANAGALPPEDLSTLKSAAFKAMREFTKDDPTFAQELIVDFLLPDCLARSVDEAETARADRASSRECLREWLEGYPDPEQSLLRDSVLERFIPASHTRLPDLPQNTALSTLCRVPCEWEPL
jgi:hypothetical protein